MSKKQKKSKKITATILWAKVVVCKIRKVTEIPPKLSNK